MQPKTLEQLSSGMLEHLKISYLLHQGCLNKHEIKKTSFTSGIYRNDDSKIFWIVVLMFNQFAELQKKFGLAKWLKTFNCKPRFYITAEQKVTLPMYYLMLMALYQFRKELQGIKRDKSAKKLFPRGLGTKKRRLKTWSRNRNRNNKV